MAQAISAVGTLASAESQTARTLSINPTTIGNLVVMYVILESETPSQAPTAVTGGHCVGLDGASSWTKLVAGTGLSSNSTPKAFQLSLWAGQASATGATNATVTTSAPSGTWMEVSAQQFTCSGIAASTVWAADGTGTKQNTTASTTVIYPTLVPSDTGRMYVGAEGTAGVGITTGGSAGYTVQIGAEDNAYIYNTAVSGSQSPTSKFSGSAKSGSLAALIYATNPGNPAAFMPFFGAL